MYLVYDVQITYGVNLTLHVSDFLVFKSSWKFKKAKYKIQIWKY